MCQFLPKISLILLQYRPFAFFITYAPFVLNSPPRESVYGKQNRRIQMAYKRKTSNVIKNAQVRAANLEAISGTLDLGNGLTLVNLQAEIAAAQALLDDYNIKLAQADAALNSFKAKEKELKTLNARLLAGVGVIYGKDSNQYEQAGGTRTSEIVRGAPVPNPGD